MTLHEPVRSILDSSLAFLTPILTEVNAFSASTPTVRTVQDMRRLANQKGFRLRHTRTLPLMHPGFSIVLGNTRYIAVKRDLHPTEEIYTIAHEIGHHQIHLARPSLVSPAQREYEANLFAALLTQRIAPYLAKDMFARNIDGRMAATSFAIAGGAIAVAAAGSWLINRIARSS